MLSKVCAAHWARDLIAMPDGNDMFQARRAERMLALPQILKKVSARIYVPYKVSRDFFISRGYRPQDPHLLLNQIIQTDRAFEHPHSHRPIHPLPSPVTTSLNSRRQCRNGALETFEKIRGFLSGEWLGLGIAGFGRGLQFCKYFLGSVKALGRHEERGVAHLPQVSDALSKET